MSKGIGIIGAGVMGYGHAEILQTITRGAEIVAVADADPERAKRLALLGSKIRVTADAMDVVADPKVDAVIVVSPDATHYDLAIACIRAGKPVLVEKPLAETSELCRMIVEAEISSGLHLVQVGFMRRFDPGYRALRKAVVEGSLGAIHFLHCLHRNQVAPDYVTSDNVIMSSAVHEMDIARYVLGEDFRNVFVTPAPPSSRISTRRPQFLVLQTVSGIVVDVEALPDAHYGYDVRGELVGENGTLSLNPQPAVSQRRNSLDGIAVTTDWIDRFADAYRMQLQSWVDGLTTGKHHGATAWDGYMATRAAEIGLASSKQGQLMVFDQEKTPDFYRRA